MKKLVGIAAVSVALFASAAFAEGQKTAPASTNAVSSAERRAQLKKAVAEQQKRTLAITGGMVVKPGSMQGSLRFVNAQSRVPSNLLEKPVARITHQYRFDLKLVDSKKAVKTFADIAAAKKESGANLAVVIVDVADLPAMIVVPEDGWAAVNVAKLGDAKLDMRFYSARVRKEMYRAFAYVAGAIASRYDGNLMDPITSLEQLDEHPEGGLPIDVYARLPAYLKKVGVTIGEWMTYREALDEGWAPEPADDNQRNVKAKWEADKKAKKSAK